MTTKGQCPNCGSHNAVTYRGQHHFQESGLDNVTLLNVEVQKCEDCKERIVSVPQAKQLLSLIGERIILKPTTLSGPEIRFLRKNIFLKTEEFAHILGVARQTVSRWENGHSNPVKPEDRLIRLVYSEYAKIGDPTRSKLIEMFRLDEFKELSNYNLMCQVFPELRCELEQTN
jgi:putative zinc finger/helix-turn-helix YgiT family protein